LRPNNRGSKRLLRDDHKDFVEIIALKPLLDDLDNDSLQLLSTEIPAFLTQESNDVCSIMLKKLSEVLMYEITSWLLSVST
jgi:hypothetical protein